MERREHMPIAAFWEMSAEHRFADTRSPCRFWLFYQEIISQSGPS
jgi:hypothetical protein